MTDWHEEARRLRRLGHSYGEVARLLGRSASGVKWAIDCSNQREKAQVRYQLRKYGCPAITAGGHYKLFEAHKPRQIKVILPRAVKDEAVRLFAAGQIDRAELSRLLRSGVQP